METDSGIIELIQKAGIFAYPIILCSVVGMAIFLQKMFTLRTKKIIPERFLNHLYSLLAQGKAGEAQVYARSNDSAVSRVAIAALENAERPKEELREEIEEAGRKEANDLGRYIEGLGAVSNVSTLLGLLGTISGMIKIFRVIADKPIVNPPELAGGISEALYTTAFGLLIAIPAFIAYKYLNGRADDFVSMLEEEGRKIMDYVLVSNEVAPGKTEDMRDILG